jgi:transposase
VAVDETVVKMYGLRAYVWSAVDVDSGEILAIYASRSRNMLIAMKFLRIVLDRCLNKPLIIVDRGPWYRWAMESLGLKYRYQRFGLRNSSQNYLSFSFLVFFMEFRELSDFEWEVIKPLLPPMSRVGRPRTDDRLIINGILYVLTTGCRWMDMPLEYGSYKTAWRRLKKWQEMGIWDSIFKALASLREHGMVSVDSSTVEAKKGER